MKSNGKRRIKQNGLKRTENEIIMLNKRIEEGKEKESNK